MGELDDHRPGRVGVGPNKRRDRVQGVKKEMGVDLICQSVQPRLDNQHFLLRQLHFQTSGIPDFEREPDATERPNKYQEHNRGIGRTNGKKQLFW